jgi:hypothetical protein
MRIMRHTIVAVSTALALLSAAAAGQGPVQVARQGRRIALSNDNHDGGNT